MQILNFSCVVEAENGLHMRTASKLVSLAKEFEGQISLIHSKTGKMASAANPLSLMLLDIRKGDRIQCSISADNAESMKEQIEIAFSN